MQLLLASLNLLARETTRETSFEVAVEIRYLFKDDDAEGEGQPYDLGKGDHPEIDRQHLGALWLDGD